MSHLKGDIYSLALKMASGLEKGIVVDLLRPYAETVEKYFGLPVTPSDVDNWDYPFFGMYRLILSGELSSELFELFSLLAYISNEFDFADFKNEYYRLLGIKKLSINPSMRYAGRIAQMWHLSSDTDKRKLLDQWHCLTAKLNKSVTYSFFPLSTSFNRETAADPSLKEDFLHNLGEDLLQKGAIPNARDVVHKRIKDEDWFWFILCAQNGKICMSCCSHPGVVVYNRKQGMLRTSNIKRDVHHLSCVIHSFGTAYFGDCAAFVTMNKKLMKHFNIWGVQRLIGENDGPGRPELVSMGYSTYDTSDTVIKCGNGLEGVKTLSKSEEVGYVHCAHFKMSMFDSKEKVCRKDFKVYAGNMLAFERGSEEDRVLDWLVDMKIVKTGKERDSDSVYCGDISKRVKWMDKYGILGKPCALWQFRELFGEYFCEIEKHLVKTKDQGKTDHYRERNGASMTIVGGMANGLALWEGRVGETDYIRVDEKELALYTLSLHGREIACQLKRKEDAQPKSQVGRKRGDSKDGADMAAAVLEISKLIEKGMKRKTAIKLIYKKSNLKILEASLSRYYRRVKNNNH